MADGIDVVAGALASFRESNGGDDSSGMDSMGNAVFSPADTGSEGVDAAGSDVEIPAGGEQTTEDKIEEAVAQGATPDEIDQILEAEGIKPPIQGQRENRIPHSQVKRIVTNAKTKWQKEADRTFATERTQFQQSQERLRNWEAAEQLAATDPEKYLRTLAQLNPGYQKFLEPITAAVTQQGAADKSDPEPQPTKMADGTFAFTTEQWKEHQVWERRQAVKEATAAMKAELKPVLDAEKQRQERAAGEKVYNDRLKVVQAQYSRLTEIYGAEMVKANEEAMTAKMKEAEAEGYIMPMAEAAMLVLMPLVRAEANKQRQKVIGELKGRPAAANGAVGAAQKSDQENAPVTGEGVIHEALRNYRQGRTA